MQLKGCQKRIVCMRPEDSRLFAEAFFVLREGATQPQEADMLAEANRILDEHLLSSRHHGERVRGRGGALLLLLGGAALASLFWGGSILLTFLL